MKMLIRLQRDGKGIKNFRFECYVIVNKSKQSVFER